VSLGLRLGVRQSQGLVLTPQLQQAIKLLQLSNLELAAVVAREVAENPFLRHPEGGEAPAPHRTARSAALDGQPGLRPAAPGIDEPRLEPPPVAHDNRLGLARAASRAFDPVPPSPEERLARAKGLRELLAEEVGAQIADLRLRLIALRLVEEVEDDGYLREPDTLLAERLGVAEPLVAAARRVIQRCGPTGVGARDLAECLALQLAERDRLDPAMRKLLENLSVLARADFAALMRLCAVDADDLQEMIAEIKALSPRPGLAWSADPPEVAVPDILVQRLAGGRWRVELNPATLPRVLVDSAYFAELSSRKLERPDRDYLSERMQAASWLAKALDQRARTVLRVAKAIFARQLGFLEAGVTALRPLVLRDIAEATGLHESTVSRATADKLVATPRGTFPLKYFFTTAIAAKDGAGSHSAEAIRQQIKRMIEREDPDQVLSDDEVVSALETQGVAIARRTVAKYREALGIASSVRRRRVKALGR
jgi:RNA polymerase sigma-54 factor